MRKLALALVSATIAVAGCDSDTKSVAAADLATVVVADMAGGSQATRPVTITVSAPATFSGTPRQLVVAAFDSLPVAGPPAAVLYQGNNPAIVAGQTLSVTGDAGTLSGNKYVIAVLYMQGGGQLAPMAGVDYVSGGTQTSFDSHTAAIGPLMLMKLPGDM